MAVQEGEEPSYSKPLADPSVRSVEALEKYCVLHAEGSARAFTAPGEKPERDCRVAMAVQEGEEPSYSKPLADPSAGMTRIF
jgi:hypothetical protein